MTLSQKLVILRKTKGITQDELAKALDVSRQSVHKWESGQCYPEVPKIIKMKEIFEISIDDLLDENFEIALPEKKKHRSQKKDSAEKNTDNTITKSNTESNDNNIGTEGDDSTADFNNTEIEEIAVEVIEEKEAEQAIDIEIESPSKKEERVEAEEKKKGFFSKIFGRK